jgi:hypothetical protein
MVNTANLYAVSCCDEGDANVDPGRIVPGTIEGASVARGEIALKFNAADAPGGAYRAGPESMDAPPAKADPVGEITTETREALGIGDYRPDPLARRWGLATTSNTHGVLGVSVLLASSIATMTAAVVSELSEKPPKELEYQPIELVTLSHPGKGKSGAKGAEGAKRSQAKPDFKPPSKGMPIDARVDNSAPDFIPNPKGPTKPKVKSETVGASQYGIKNLNRGTGGFGSGLLGQGTGGGGNGGGQGFGRIHGLGKVDTGGGIGVDTRIGKPKKPACCKLSPLPKGCNPTQCK